MLSRDVTNPSKRAAIGRLHAGIEGVHHCVNIGMERLDLNWANSAAELSKAIALKFDGALNSNLCHMPGEASHMNACSEAAHFDTDSCWGVYDIIVVVGNFHSCYLHFPKQGISLSSKPGDLFFLRGGAMKHGVMEWKGSGRMVIAPFIDGALYPYFNIAAPQSLTPLYGKRQSELRTLFPATNVETLRTGPPKRSIYWGRVKTSKSAKCPRGRRATKSSKLDSSSAPSAI